MAKKLTKKTLRRRARNHVLLQGSPRLYMFCVLAVTLLTAFLVSVILLHLGVTRMWIRYGIAAIVGYAAFFFYLHVLLFYVYKIQSDKGRIEAEVEDVIDLVDGATDMEFGDGGGSSSGGLDGLDLFGEGEAVAVVIAIVLVLGVFLASFYVIYIAPEILFEVTFDAFVGIGYLKILKSEQKKHWSESAIKATWAPFLITLVLVVASGALLQAIVPEAIRFKDIFSR